MAARRGQASVPGHWEAIGGRYAWRGGYWQARRAGYRNVPHGRVMRPGHRVR
ncbi:hypothetical protein [Cupriavidus sp. TMH.W2]|uniref:hypothetical protein n=1 Tax=Cupriavidus sp. TMH.W2 TaxID=3434465 RepID=UPI003D76FECE